MAGYFKRILIPIDFSINTDTAINKGLELADSGTAIHLLYIHSLGLPGLTGIVKRFITEAAELPDYKLVKKKMGQWKDCIEESSNDIFVHTWIVWEGSVQKAIEKKAEELAVDLVIIGKNSNHSWFPFFNTVVPGKLVKKTGPAVLTIKPGILSKKNQTTILAVTNETAYRKMEIISSICRKFRVKIYLVTFLKTVNDAPGFPPSSFLQVYQYLKSIHSNVEYALLHGSNKAKSIMEYAEKINADIILVHPEEETKIGWPDRHISDVLPKGSKVQVWTV